MSHPGSNTTVTGACNSVAGELGPGRFSALREVQSLFVLEGMSLPVSLWVKLTHVHPGAQEYSGEEARVRRDPI